MFETKIREVNRTTKYSTRAGKYTIAEVQKILYISRPTVYKLINEGILKAVKIGSHTMITKASLDEWLDDDKEDRNGINI